MHPTLARFLDVGKTIALLDRAATATRDPDEAAFLKASAADAGLTTTLREAKGVERPGPDAQQALLVLAVRAAVDRMTADAVLGPLAQQATAALSEEGASPTEVVQLLGTVLLEEGFADDGDPVEFDLEFVRETLATLPALARLDADKVDALLEGFVAQQHTGTRPLALRAADTFLGEAWGEGLQPLTSEHVEFAVEVLWNEASAADIEKLVDALRGCLSYLEGAGLIGPSRRRRLEATAGRTLQALRDGGADDEEDEADDDDDDAGPSEPSPETDESLN